MEATRARQSLKMGKGRREQVSLQSGRVKPTINYLTPNESKKVPFRAISFTE